MTGTLTITNIRTVVDSLNPPQSSIFTRLNTIGGSLIIQSSPAFTSLGNGSFPALVSINGFLRIQVSERAQNVTCLHRMNFICGWVVGGYICQSRVMSRLLRVTHFSRPPVLSVSIRQHAQSNAHLASLSMSFPILRNIGGAISIVNQPLLGRNVVPGAFASLATIGGVSLTSSHCF